MPFVIYFLFFISISGLAFYIIYVLMDVSQRYKAGIHKRSRIPFAFKLAIPIGDYFVGIIKKYEFGGYKKNITKKILNAGLDEQLNAEEFISIKIVLGLALFIFTAICLKRISWFTAVMGGLGYIYPSLWLKVTLGKRHKGISRNLPYVLDLLTLSVEAGLDFLAGLKRIIEKKKDDPLAEELRIVFNSIQMGKTRRVALRDMGERVGSSDVMAVVSALIQGDELGVGIGTVLRIQANQMRIRRFQLAEKLAMEAPLKLLFPLLVFIFPTIFIILLGPLILNVLIGQ